MILRGEKDHQDGRNITFGRDKEKSFLDKHPEYHTVSERLGVDKLCLFLNQLLTSNIKKYLPTIRSKIYSHLQANEEEIRQLGDFPEEGITLSHKKTIILNIISRFSNQFSDLMYGKECISKNGEVFGGARINYLFNEVFRNKISSISPFTTLSDLDVRVAIRNSNGLNPSLLVSEAAFEMLVRDQISKH